MATDLSVDLRAAPTQARDPEGFQLPFGHACAERLRHRHRHGDEEAIGAAGL